MLLALLKITNENGPSISWKTLLFLFKYISKIAFESVIVGVYWFKTRGTDAIPQAKWAGKIKMIIQSFALFFLIISVLNDVPTLGVVSGWMIGVSFVFAGISVFTYNSL